MALKGAGGDSHHHSSSKRVRLELPHHHRESQRQEGTSWAVLASRSSQPIKPWCPQVVDITHTCNPGRCRLEAPSHTPEPLH